MPRDCALRRVRNGHESFRRNPRARGSCAAACGAGDDDRAGPSRILRNLRRDRRREIGNLRRHRRGRHCAPAGRLSLFRTACGARAEQSRVSRILDFGERSQMRRVASSPAKNDEGMKVSAKFSAAPCNSGSALPASTIATNAVAALLAVAALERRRLQRGCGAFRILRAQRSRRAIEPHDRRRHDAPHRRKLQRQSRRQCAAALANLGQHTGRRGVSRSWATCWSWAPKALNFMPTFPTPSRRRRADRVFLCGAQMAALWNRLPASRRGAYGVKSGRHRRRDNIGIVARRRCGAREGFVRQQDGGDRRCAESARGARGKNVSLFSRAAVRAISASSTSSATSRSAPAGGRTTALLIAFMVGPAMIRWLRRGRAKASRSAPTARSGTSSRSRARPPWAAC